MADSSFSAEVCNWLETSGFECFLTKKEEDLFFQLSVIHHTLKVMEIKLIETGKWSVLYTKTEYNAYLERQNKQRTKGVSSIILWEDLWWSKKTIVQSRISALLGKSIRIPGRLTYVSRLSKEIAAEFLKNNHLQGSVSAKYRYGLYLPLRYFRVLPPDFAADLDSQDLLVAVASFSNARIFSKENKPFRSHELIRFANLLNTTVVGGLDKLINAFIKDFQPDDIMTYADLEWSDGKGYSRLGFEKISLKPPMTFLLDLNTLDRLPDKKLDDNSDFLNISNAGSIKFVRTIKKLLNS